MGNSGKHYARWMCEIKNEEPRLFETIATLPGGWDLAHAIRLGIKLFAELGANSQALSGSHVDSPCSCRAIFESAPVAMLQSRLFGYFAKSPSPALKSVKSFHFPPDLLWRISTTQRLIMPRIIEFPTLVQGDERGRNSILQLPRSPARAECVAQAETERGVPGWVAPGDCSPGGRVRR